MKSREITVTARDGSGIEEQADLIVCEVCDGEDWHLYQLKRAAGGHPHIQCTACGTTFCCGNCDQGAVS